jgi:hypothetical protein
MKTNRWNKRMASLLILLAGWQMTARPGVIITGLLHGTLTGGSPKAIELFITGTENLYNYEVWRSLNGAPFGSGSGSISSMTGIFTNTFVFLVKSDQVDAFHSVFGDEGIFANVLPMSIISGNGNDGFQVRLKTGSVIIDQVWLEDAAYSYRDSFWYRKHGTGPDSGWLSSAWETPGNDALDGMDEAGLRAAVPFGTYAITWTGLTSMWNDSSNWSSGIPPSFQTNVLITGTAAIFPVIDNQPENPAVCLNLTVADTASLTVNAGKALTVKGNLNLEIQEAGETQYGLFLKSDPDQTPTGSVVLSGNASGTSTVERFIAKNNSWHFLSSPVQEQDFQPEFVPDPLDQSFDLYYWEENASPTAGWINIRDENGQWNPQFGDAFITGKGYLAAYSANYTGEQIKRFSGLINSGNFSFPLGYSVNYWNLLGNPYPCALDWSSDGIIKSAVAAGTMYIWDPDLNNNLGGYRAHNGESGVPSGTMPIIPAMQGFFIQSLQPGNLSVDISNHDPLVHSLQSYYKSTKEPTLKRIRLKISKDQLSDETLIYFDPAATNQFDPRFDAEKLFNGHAECPEIFSVADRYTLCINILLEVPASVPLGVSYGQEDSLSLTAFDFDGIPEETGIFLEDNMENMWVDMRKRPEYRYYHDPLQPAGRLTLHFMNVTGHTQQLSKNRMDFWSSQHWIFVLNPGNTKGEICLYSMDGQLIERYEALGEHQIIQPEVPSGLYILRIISPECNFGRKIFIY